MHRPVRFSDDIEPLVQFIEETDPKRILEATLTKLRDGLSVKKLLTASALAVTRSSDLPPGHHGGPLHPLVGLHALHNTVERVAGEKSRHGTGGLGLRVIDTWTGQRRDPATLSGGETFIASLALALGLADVVTDEAGGIRLDTLFIDEGFGSLDDQTLDEVLDVLDSLRERDRSVGIVSHVADLRRRIHAQLEVVKGRSGSTLRQRGH
jgi:hypothetical protein